MRQRRWLCDACGREWLDTADSAIGCAPWSSDMGCPTCHSSAIAEHAYVPDFPGADIPRHRLEAPPPPVSEAPAAAQEPALALVAAGIPEFD
jgi:hypothetical protein